MAEFVDPWEEKKSSFGMGESPVEFADPWEEPEPSGLLRRGVVDPLVGLAKGVVVNVPQTALGLLDIPTMGYAGKAADVALKATLGIGVKEAGEKFDELLSPEARFAKQKVEEAEGFIPVLKTALQYPSSIVQAAAENLPTMYGGAAIGRKIMEGIGLGIAAKGITATQKTGRAIAAGATGEAIVTAGQNIEQVRQEAIGGTLSPSQVGINMVSAALTGLIGAAGGKLAQRLGFVDVDTLLAGGRGITPFDKATSIKGVLVKIVGGAISEGAFEELPQSMQEQIAQNISLGKPAGEGVLESGAMGMLVGALLGAFGAGVAEMTPTQKRLREDPLDQEIHKQIGELPEEEAAIKLAPPVEEPPITGEPPVEEPPPVPPEGPPVAPEEPPPAPPVVPEEPLEGPEPPVVPEAPPVTREPDYAAEATQAGVIFNGLQETGEGKRPLPLFTDPATKSTFTLREGETIPDALARVREKFKPEKPVSAPRFNPAGYASEGEALASIKAKKRNLADFNVEKVDNRWMVTPKEGTPAEIAQAEEKPLRGAEGPEKVAPTPMMKDIAKAIDYKGRKFRVDQKIPQRLDSYWDGGSRDYYYFYNPQNGKIQEVHSNHPFYEADRPRDLNDLPPGIVLVRRTYFQGKDIGLTLYASPAPTAPALEAPKPAPVTVTEVKPGPAERLAEPIPPERMKTLDKLTEMARSLSRKDELATIPVKGYSLSPSEQQELVKRGIAFDVDRMGEPQIRLSKETRINELRAKVAAKRKAPAPPSPEQIAKKKALMSIPANQAVDFIIKNGYLNIENVRALSKQDAIRLNRRFFNRAPFGKMGSIARKGGKLGLDEVAAEFPQYFGTEQKNPDEHLLDVLLERGISKTSLEGKTEAEIGATEYEHYIKKHGITGEDALSGEDQERIEGISLDEIAGEAGLTEEERRLALADAGEFFGAVAKLAEATAKEAAPTPEVAPAEKVPPVKEPWEMTFSEYKQAVKRSGNYPSALLDYPAAADDYFKKNHKLFIQKALAEGKPVPPSVLKDYPELQKEAAPPKEAYIGKTETAELGGPLSAAATFELAPTETEMGELKPKDRGPKTEGMFEETKYGELGPEDTWGGYGEWLDTEVRQAWTKKLEDYENELRRIEKQDGTGKVASDTSYGGEHEVSIRRRLRDRRLFDEEVRGANQRNDRQRWEGVEISPEFADTPEFKLGEQHFASLGYQTVPVTRLPWGMAVNTDTKVVFMGEMGGDRFAYFMSHEISHILSAQGNEAVNAIKAAIDLSHPLVIKQREGYDWTDDYTRDEFAASIVGGVVGNESMLKGDQTKNIKAAREAATNEGKPTGTIKAGPAYGFVQPRPPAFYSKLSQTIQGASFTKMPVPQLKAFLKGKQVTDAEIENITGNLTGIVTKQQVQEEIKANSTEFQDVVLGETPGRAELVKELDAIKDRAFTRTRLPSGNFDYGDELSRVHDLEVEIAAMPIKETKFDAVTSKGVEGGIPGTYRELTVTLPTDLVRASTLKGPKEVIKQYLDGMITGKEAEERGMSGYLPSTFGKEGWKDQHSQYSDIANPVIRVHFDDRESNGKRILFIREMQSIAKNKPAGMPQWAWDRAYDIGVKRILAYAKESGYDGVAWSPGRIVNDRYNLRKQVSEEGLKWSLGRDGRTDRVWLDAKSAQTGTQVLADTYPLAKLPDIVGKEIAARITKDIEAGSTYNTIKGEGLEVGGTGILDVYDRRLPSLFKKYGKEGVGEVLLDSGELGGVKMPSGYAGRKFNVPYIPITEKTPTTYTIYGDVSPKQGTVPITQKMLPFVRDLADRFMDKPQETIPQEDLAEFKTWFLAQKDLKTWERVFELPWTLARKHPIWRKAFQIFGLDRPEMRGKLIHKFAVVAEPYLALEKNMREAGKSKAEIKDAKERLARVIITGDAVLGPQLKAMRRQLRNMKAGPQRDTLIVRIKQIETENRYSDEDLLKGIKDDQGNTVKLNKEEVELYKSVRNSLDLMFDTYLNHIKAQSFRTYRKQKWYAILAQAADMDLTQDQTLSILKTGLNQAALLRAVKIQPDIQRIFERVENQIASTPDVEKITAGELYGTIADKLTKEIGDLRTAIGTLTGITEYAELTDMTRGVLNAYMFTRPYLKKIKTLRNTYKKQVAFFPRVREQGPYKLKLMKRIYNKEGLVVKEEQLFMEMFENYDDGEKLYKKIYKLYGKNGVLPDDMYIPKPDPANVTPEFAFQGVSDINMQSLLDDAIEGMKIRDVYYDKKGNKVNIQERLRDMGYQALAKQFQARGFGRHMIHRQWNVVKGYEENNLQSVLTNYMSGMSGMMTKQIAAADFLELMKELGPGEKGHFKGLSMYGRGQLRNTTRADRIGGGLRAWAFTWVLGGVLRPAVLQFTQNYVTGIPKHAKWLRENNLGGFGKADKDYNKAMKDLVTKNLTPLEKQMQAELFTSGHTVDQYVREMFDALGNRFDQERAKWLRWLAYPFSQMEQFNRKSAALTRFRPAYQLALKEGLSEEEAYKKAYNSAIDFIGDTHYFMGKPNLPLYAQGEGMGIALRTGLTFKSFMHNFVLQIKSDLAEGDWKTVMHQMAYIVLFGGMMGLPFFKDLFEWVEKEFGYSFTKSIRQTLRSAGGKTLETFGMNGLPAMLGANMSGSLAIGIPFLGEETMATIGGVYEGQLKKLKLGAEAALRGDKYRAVLGMTPEFFRSPLIAAQESELGKEVFGTPGYTTTIRGQPVWGKEGKPLAMGPYEALAKAGGFLPTEFGREREMGQTVKRLELWATEKKQDAGERFRIARVQKDPKALKNLMEDVREINQGIRARGLQNLVPLASVQRIIQSSREVKNLKQRREQAFKRAEL